jgi:hypothetical protein
VATGNDDTEETGPELVICVGEDRYFSCSAIRNARIANPELAVNNSFPGQMLPELDSN